jgi:4-hydroxybenzoate polyprenyltransferase
MERIEKIIKYLSENPPSPLAWIGTFAGIIATRLFLDGFIPQKGEFTLATATDIHNFLFFLLSALLLWLFLALLLKENPLKTSKIVLWASLMFIFPPILDMLKTGGKIFWSPYLFNSLSGLSSQFLSFFGNLPTGMVYFGTRIIVAASIVFFAGLIYIKTKNILRAAIGALGTYTILFFMASIPSWGTFFFYLFSGSKKVSTVSSIDVVQLFGAPQNVFGTSLAGGFREAVSANLNLFYFMLLCGLLLILFFTINKHKLLAVIKNVRLPQIMVHGGLFLAGLGSALLIYPQNLELSIFSVAAVLDLLAAIIFAWMASVIVNDIADFAIDSISNPARPLQEKIFSVFEYKQLGIIFFLLSLLGGLVVGAKFAALLLIYQFLAWAYSAEPFRLKKFPLVATFISSAALLVVLFTGFTLVSGDNNLAGLSWRVILLLLVSFTLVLPLKDFRDIEGDRKDRIWTIPVIFGDKNGRLVNAVGAFIPFILSVFFLNEPRLFWWAVIFGSAAFLTIITKKPRQLFWWVLGITAAYAVVLVKVIFF